MASHSLLHIPYLSPLFPAVSALSGPLDLFSLPSSPGLQQLKVSKLINKNKQNWDRPFIGFNVTVTGASRKYLLTDYRGEASRLWPEWDVIWQWCLYSPFYKWKTVLLAIAGPSWSQENCSPLDWVKTAVVHWNSSSLGFLFPWLMTAWRGPVWSVNSAMVVGSFVVSCWWCPQNNCNMSKIGLLWGLSSLCMNMGCLADITPRLPP